MDESSGSSVEACMHGQEAKRGDSLSPSDIGYHLMRVDFDEQ